MDHATARDVSAFVLAGGKSSRMGRDKALLEFTAGTTLLEHALETLSAVCTEVAIVGPRERYAQIAASFVEDFHPACGPLGGIHAALSASTSNLNLVIGVDMPLLNSALLKFLVDCARGNGSSVTAPRVGGQIQPLCAVYRREFASAADSALNTRRNKIIPLIEAVGADIIEESELLSAGFHPDQFANVNTPEEFEHWRQVVSSAISPVGKSK